MVYRFAGLVIHCVWPALVIHGISAVLRCGRSAPYVAQLIMQSVDPDRLFALSAATMSAFYFLTLRAACLTGRVGR
jgi:hypothetical protein